MTHGFPLRKTENVSVFSLLTCRIIEAMVSMLFVMFCRNFLMRNFSGVDFSATNTADKIRISHSKFFVHVYSIELQNVFCYA